MSWLHASRHWLRTLFDRGRLAREMDDEMRVHLELAAMDPRGGDAPAAAAAAARRRFGHTPSIREERRRASGLSVVDRLSQDGMYALRQLVRAPGFTAAVALTIALGVGANATMFAIVDRIMLRAPEGVTDPERLVELRSWRQRADGTRDTSSSFAYPSFMEFRAMGDVFQHVAAVRGPIDVDVDRGVDAVSLRAAVVSGAYFQALGVHAALGRFFHESETREPDGAPVAVISHALWQRRYGEAADVLGRPLLAAGNTYTIVGVAPRGFTGHSLGRVDVWLPIAASPGIRWGGSGWEHDRGTRWLIVLARLREGVTAEQAAARAGAGWTAWSIRPGRPATAPALAFASLIPGRNYHRPEYRVATLLSGVALLLLGITCANVANLLLARALARRREVAIRLALGVSRSRLASLFVLDAVLLAMLGAVGALVLAQVGIPVVRSILFAGTETGDWAVNGRVAIFALLVALSAGVVAGIVPALQASRPGLLGALRRTHDGLVHRSRTRRSLLVAQGALTLALLAGTGLFVRSLQRIGEREIGLDLHRVVVANFSDRGTEFDTAVVRQLNYDLRERARALPGIESVSLTVGVPFEGQYALPLVIPGHDSIPGMERGRAPFVYAVTSDYFRTMGTRIIAGRSLAEADDVAGAPAVAVVSASMARLIWPNGALGQCFSIRLRMDTADCVRVVGVAEDAKRESLTADGDREAVQYYVPISQAPPILSELTLLLRSADTRAAAQSFSAMARTLRPDMPFVQVRTLEEAVAPELRPWRVGASVFGLFGALALLVAAVGTYSVIQFGVTQRRHELGVRVALGARGRQIVAMVVGDTLRLALLAGALGLALVLAGGRFVTGLLYETSPKDATVLAVAALVLVGSSLAAALLPALRATRVDPLSALRSE